MNTGIRILLATDEVSDLPGYARRIFDDAPGLEVSAKPVSTGIEANAELRGVQVQLCDADQLEDALTTRATNLGIDYDAIVLTSVRVWALAKTLAKWIRSVRGLPDGLVSPNRARVNKLPIVIGIPLNLLGNAAAFDSGAAEIEKAALVEVQGQGEQLVETVARAVAIWQAHALLDCTRGRIGMTIGDEGDLELDMFVPLPSDESEFFGPPGGSSAPPRMLRLPRQLLATDAALSALEETLNRVARLPSSQQEPALQQCLEAHPVLVTQGCYDYAWAQPRLESDDALQRTIIPDFIAVPGGSDAAFRLRPKVLDLKTSEEVLTKRGKPSSFLLKAADQVRGRYARYFENPRNERNQLGALGQVLERPKFAIIVGRNRDPDEMHELRRSQSQSEWSDLQIESYDDLIDRTSTIAELIRIANQKTGDELS